MNALARFNPFKQLARLDPVTDLDEMFRGLGLRSLLRELDAPLEMRMDITDEDKAYLVQVDVPGAKKDDIDVQIDGNRISIRAEVKGESEKKQGKKGVVSERYCGSSFRSFTLPEDVDATTAKAQYENGVLSLTLPKKSNGNAHRLAIG